MKVKYLGKGTFNGQEKFDNGDIKEVSDEYGMYLVDTFKGVFEVIEAPKPAKATKAKRTSDED